MVDLGTGGGELLFELVQGLGNEAPHSIYATEAWDANIPIARKRLEPHGITVVPFVEDSRLPLGEGQFDLAINKHESFDPAELRRILQPRATFLTQQVGGRDLLEINEALGSPPPEYSEWSLEVAVRGLEKNGFNIERAEEAMVETRSADVGALVGFLRIIDWQVPGFSVENYRDPLWAIPQRIQEHGPLIAHGHRFLIQATRS